MKAKDLIRGVLDKSESKGVDSAARKILADDIYAELSKHYHLFKKNELIVKMKEEAAAGCDYGIGG